jgi:predicted NBD/HSP70 family sugar kinase
MRRNANIVLDLLGSRSEGLTRSELKDLTGLSKPTIQAILAELRDSGHIAERVRNGNGNGNVGGRPPWAVVLTREAGLVAGVDIGHGHIRVGIADRSGRIVGKVAEDTALDADAVGPPALKTVIKLLDTALHSGQGTISALRALVVGIPAAVDRDGRVLFSESLPAWAAVNPGDELYKLLKQHYKNLRIDRDDIRLENDANLGAVGEGHHGGAVGAHNYLYVKASIGIGMGLVLRGRLYRGCEGAAGELGHTTASPMAAPFLRSKRDPPSRPCPRCSKLDCLENLASGQAIVRGLEPETERVSDQLIEQIIERATAGATSESDDLPTIVDSGTLIGYTLTDIVRVLAPEVIMIGGLLASAGEVLGKPIKDAIAGEKGLPPVKVKLVEQERIRQTELDGALVQAARLVAAREAA